MNNSHKPFRKVVGSEVTFSIPPDHSCPCGSNLPANECCLRSTGFYKEPSNTTPRGTVTGISRSKCYANQLNDCCKKMSREHFISRNLLKYLSKDNKLNVTGLNWVTDEHKAISPESFAANILCERHNNILTTLDSIALRLFHSMNESDLGSRPEKELFLFSGNDLERWLLKILCGLLSSKSWVLDNDINRDIPKMWLDILFGKSEFSYGKGLYVCNDVGHVFSGITGIQAQAIATNKQISGLRLQICGYEFILSMLGLPSYKFDERNFVYRPLELYATNGEYEKSIFFSWQGAADLGTITLNLNDT